MKQNQIQKSLLRADTQYLLFSEIYHHFNEPKAKRRAFGIMEATIACVAKHGFANVTVGMIAREAGVSRTLLNHYFKDLQEIQEISIKYIRLLFQKLAVDFFDKDTKPNIKLENYIDACFFWVDNFPKHFIVWFAFLHKCSVSKKERALNTRAVAVGQERILGLLDSGRLIRIFSFEDGAETAKLIQSLITGALFSLMTEDMPDPKAYRASIKKQCLKIAGASTSLAN